MHRFCRVMVNAGILLSVCTSLVFAEGSRQRAEIVVPEGSSTSYERFGYAPAVKIDGVIYVSGVIVYLEGEGTYAERYARGFESALGEIETVLREAGASLDDVIDITTYHTDLQRQMMPAVNKRMQSMARPHPAWTAVGTTALATPDGVTEIKVIAHVSQR